MEVETKRSKAELDVVGVKIPGELVTLFGLPALWVLLVQFIATCHYILQNTRQISSEIASKWLNVIKHPVLLFLGFLTIGLLPAGAAIASMPVVPPKDDSNIHWVLTVYWLLVVFTAVTGVLAGFHLSYVSKWVYIERRDQDLFCC
jgi:hypothetical protein